MSKREIKFRAWDDIYKRFTTSGIYLSNTTMTIDCVSKIIPEQFTGLKDKNGEDIFEGDKIRYSNSIEYGEGIIDYSAGFIIVWDLPTVKTKNPMIMQPLFYFQCSAEIEVIGNIHEIKT